VDTNGRAPEEKLGFFARLAESRWFKAFVLSVGLARRAPDTHRLNPGNPIPPNKRIEAVRKDATRPKTNASGGSPPPPDTETTPVPEPGSPNEGKRISNINDYTHNYGNADVHTPSGGTGEPSSGLSGTGGAIEAEGKELEAAAGAGKAAQIGSLIEGLGPNPVDVPLLWLGFFGSINDAEQELKADSYRKGFSYGLAARLLGFESTWVQRHVIEPPNLRSGPWGAAAENAYNAGVVAGYRDFGARVKSQPRVAKGWLITGLRVLQARDDGGEISLSHPTGDDVFTLGNAIRPAVQGKFEEWAKIQEEEKARKDLEDMMIRGRFEKM